MQAQGLGNALAKQLINEGAKVYCGVRDMKRAKAQDFSEYQKHSGCRLLKLDILKQRDIDGAVQGILKEEGRIDVLVNNAGFGLYGPFEELSEKQIREQMETNFFGGLRMARAVLPSMRERGAGKILKITSILGLIVVPTGMAYAASKWAFEAFSEVLRYELAPFGIWVSAIEPGLIRTNFKQNIQLNASLEDTDAAFAFLNKMVKDEVLKGYSGLSITAQAAGTRIMNIIAKKKPAGRYRIGLDAHLYNLLRRLAPEFLLDFLFRKYTGHLYKKHHK